MIFLMMMMIFLMMVMMMTTAIEIAILFVQGGGSSASEEPPGLLTKLAKAIQYWSDVYDHDHHDGLVISVGYLGDIIGITGIC